MDNSELNRLLRSAEVPARPEDYWEDFPRLIRSKLGRPETPPRGSRRPVLAWALATAATCLVIGFTLGHWHARDRAGANNGLILQNEKFVHEILSMFPNRVRAIMKDEDGLRLVLSEEENVPLSIPLWVKVCQGLKCVTLVTFSGQELSIAGQKMTVLSDASGGVILVGDQFAWDSKWPDQRMKDLQVQARPLEFAFAK